MDGDIPCKSFPCIKIIESTVETRLKTEPLYDLTRRAIQINVEGITNYLRFYNITVTGKKSSIDGIKRHIKELEHYINTGEWAAISKPLDD